jgi:exodeoxyribonuclease VII large subunit
MAAVIDSRREVLRSRAQILWLVNPRRRIDADRQRIDGLTDRLIRVTERLLERRGGRLAVAQAALSAVSPQATLARGFAIVRDADGQVIRSRSQIGPGARVTIQVSDGTVGARVEG